MFSNGLEILALVLVFPVKSCTGFVKEQVFQLFITFEVVDIMLQKLVFAYLTMPKCQFCPGILDRVICNSLFLLAVKIMLFYFCTLGKVRIMKYQGRKHI